VVVNSSDPRVILAQEPMGRLQVVAIALCIVLLAIDGFDVLSISFAAPGIANEWGIDRAALGLVLSMELIGMGIGAFIVGDVADRIGRRPTILLCLVIVTIGMALAATAMSVALLSLYRLATGIGIGGILAATTAMVAEYANDRHRSMAVSLMAGGYPLGAIIGGAIVSVLLAYFSWRSVFVVGAALTAAFIPIVWFLLPESISFLVERRPANALESVNRTLRRMGHTAIEALPEPRKPSQTSGVRQLFEPGLARITILLTAAFFAHIMTFYFFVKWIPKLVVDMGYAASLAGSVLVWFNVGGLLGSVLFGLLTQRFNLRRLVIAALLLSAVAVAAFGQGPPDLLRLSMTAAIGGFFTNAAVVGMYAMFAQRFPTHVRAGGTGFAIGFGRGGAALGPIAAGLLFAAGGSLGMVAVIMATGSLAGAFALGALRDKRRGGD
jgi:benzoate transport